MQRDMHGCLKTVGYSSGSESRSPGPTSVFWVMSWIHRRTTPGSRLQGQTDVNTAWPHTEAQCQSALTSHINIQGGHTEGQETDSAELGCRQGCIGGGRAECSKYRTRAWGEDLTLVKIVHISPPKKTMPLRFTCFNCIYSIVRIICSI